MDVELAKWQASFEKNRASIRVAGVDYETNGRRGKELASSARKAKGQQHGFYFWSVVKESNGRMWCSGSPLSINSDNDEHVVFMYRISTVSIRDSTNQLRVLSWNSATSTFSSRLLSECTQGSGVCKDIEVLMGKNVNDLLPEFRDFLQGVHPREAAAPVESEAESAAAAAVASDSSASSSSRGYSRRVRKPTKTFTPPAKTKSKKARSSSSYKRSNSKRRRGSAISIQQIPKFNVGDLDSDTQSDEDSALGKELQLQRGVVNIFRY